MASSSSASTSTPTSGSLNNNVYEVFINFRGPDVRKTLGSHLYRRLLSHGLRVFFAVPFWQQGERLDSQIKSAIRTASVYVAILSPAYAESKWCLNELHMMLESGAPIVPLFYHVKPFELQRKRLANGDGVYGQALRMHEEEQQIDPHTIQNWITALSSVAELTGYMLEEFNMDEGILVDNVVAHVLERCKRPPLNVFLNHRGPDVKKTLASHLYHRLRSSGMEVFLDQEELEGGQNFPSRIKDAVAKASVHVAIFSPRYAESNWCMDELILMLESGTPIIPVFYHVKPADLRWSRLKNQSWWRPVKNGVYAEALHKIEMKKRFDSDTIENWRKALSTVADINGFDLETFNGDEGALLNKVVQRVLDCGKG